MIVPCCEGEHAHNPTNKSAGVESKSYLGLDKTYLTLLIWHVYIGGKLEF
jgi:hypothetical protein